MSRIIKKYPNRRLYDTTASAYITLHDVKKFVLDGVTFEVHDARTNEDLTRSILLQIILEEESGGVPMFTSDMLSNIIRYYGHAMQGLMGSYLERSIGAFHEAQRKFQEQTQSLGGAAPLFGSDAISQVLKTAQNNLPPLVTEYLEKGASQVMTIQQELRKQAMNMFGNFPYPTGAAGSANSANSANATGTQSANEEDAEKAGGDTKRAADKPARAAKTSAKAAAAKAKAAAAQAEAEKPVTKIRIRPLEIGATAIAKPVIKKARRSALKY
jgi:polyhydroxyalkanoate synthesis repressor PhaR